MEKKRQDDRSYLSVVRFGRACGVSRGTVCKWLQCGVIPEQMWYKTPQSGHVRIHSDAKKTITGR